MLALARPALANPSYALRRCSAPSWTSVAAVRRPSFACWISSTGATALDLGKLDAAVVPQRPGKTARVSLASSALYHCSWIHEGTVFHSLHRMDHLPDKVPKVACIQPLERRFRSLACSITAVLGGPTFLWPSSPCCYAL